MDGRLCASIFALLATWLGLVALGSCWIRFSLVFLPGCINRYTYPVQPLDDHLKTSHRIPCLPNILQLSRYGLLRRCRSVPGKMESGTMYVSRSSSLFAIIDASSAGLSGFTIFITILGMFFSAFMLFVPVVYEKYDKLVRVARALKEVRVSFILTGTGTVLSLLIA